MADTTDDPRRRIPRTDALLDSPRFVQASHTHGREAVHAAVTAAQRRARTGEIAPEDVAAEALVALSPASTGLTPVINATGVLVHTNIGRAPLSPAAIEAMVSAAAYVDVELDLDTGRRAPRGRGTLAALADAVPDAEDCLIVNNGAAALLLATTAVAAGREVIVSRGEMVEIGAGFRLPDLITSTGARLREVGTTNRTRVADYSAAIGPETGCILKVHPSNFRIEGFTAAAGIGELAQLGVPVVADIGSGLLRPEPGLPCEPDVTTTLRQGAAVVTASGDKLLGGPQAGLMLGRAAVIERLRRHPLARALRVDKLTLAALEATLRGPAPPVVRALRLTPEQLRRRAYDLAAAVGLAAACVVATQGRVGGGGAPGVPLPGWALALDADCATRLRRGDPAVLARIERGRCLIDPRCVEEAQLPALVTALRAALTPGS